MGSRLVVSKAHKSAGALASRSAGGFIVLGTSNACSGAIGDVR